MTQYEYDIVYNEGADWFKYGLYCTDNPYYGVSRELADRFDDGYWDAWYGEEK